MTIGGRARAMCLAAVLLGGCGATRCRQGALACGEYGGVLLHVVRRDAGLDGGVGVRSADAASMPDATLERLDETQNAGRAGIAAASAVPVRFTVQAARCPPDQADVRTGERHVCVASDPATTLVETAPAPEPGRFFRAGLGAAFVPSIARGAVIVDLQPIARRPFGGGFAYGIAGTFLDAGPTFRRATAAIVVEYDLSYLWREHVAGFRRRYELSVGVEAGLSVRTLDTEFGQLLALGLALDPFVEARVRLDDHFILALRASAPVAIDRVTTAGFGVVPGLMAEW